MSPVGEPAGGVAVVAVVEPERPAKAAQMSETRDAAVKMPAGEMAPESPDERSRADPPTEMPAANSSSDMTAANSSAALGQVWRCSTFCREVYCTALTPFLQTRS